MKSISTVAKGIIILHRTSARMKKTASVTSYPTEVNLAAAAAGHGQAGGLILWDEVNKQDEVKPLGFRPTMKLPLLLPTFPKAIFRSIARAKSLKMTTAIILTD